jgi:lysophospholipase L1-like esterase/predicted secreted protein
MATEAFIGIGTLFQNSLGGTPETWETVAETLDLTLPSLARDSIDISAGNAPGEWREFVPGMKDGGEISFQLNFTVAAYSALEAEFNQGIKRRRIIFPNGYWLPFYAFLTKLEGSIPLTDRVTAQASFKVFGQPGPLRPRWLPTDMPGLVAWYRADTGVWSDDGITPASEGEPVAQWSDLSGNQRHLRVTHGAPLFQSRGFNLKPTLRFSAEEASGMSAALAGMGALSSWSVVGQLIDDALGLNRNNGRALSYVGVTSVGDDFDSPGSAGVLARDGLTAGMRTDHNLISYNQITIGYSTSYRFLKIFNGTTVKAYVNNIERDSDTLSLTLDASGELGVGSPPNTPAHWCGPISEVVITNTALTEEERRELDLYLYDRWWSPRLGYAATRARWLEHPGAAVPSRQVMARTGHRAWADLSIVQLFVQNLRMSVQVPDLAEFGWGASATVTAAIEYPVGTFTRVTFGGVVQGTIPDADVLLSDFVDIPGGIPKGALFWVRQFWTNPNGVFYNEWRDIDYGDVTELAVSGLSDKTMGGTLTSSGNYSFPPVAILAGTDLPSVGILGDSLAAGRFDVETAPHLGDVGTIARSLMPVVPTVNLSIPGACVNAVNSHYWGALGIARTRILPYLTHIVLELGINDLAGFFTAAQTSAQMQAHYIAFHQSLFGIGLDPTAQIIQTTITPYSTSSTDGWTTTANQTPFPNDAQRIATNNLIRAGLPFVDSFYEIANVVEEPNNSGKFAAPPAITDDGLHFNVAGYQLIEDSGIVTMPEDEV